MKTHKLFLGIFVMFLSFYLFIGFASLGQVSEGVSGINYMPFFHAPWKWLFQLYRFLGLL